VAVPVTVTETVAGTVTVSATVSMAVAVSRSVEHGAYPCPGREMLSHDGMDSSGSFRRGK